jgi:hypothetical protein
VGKSGKIPCVIEHGEIDVSIGEANVDTEKSNWTIL